MSVTESRKAAERRLLNIIIVGCGNVGMTIAERLSAEGHHISVIDKNEAAVRAASDAYDVLGVVGNGSSYNVLMEAGIESADLIIAVTPSDELNLLCCTLAGKVGRCAAIARVRTPDYADELPYLRTRLGISMIVNPELEAAREMARLLRLPSAISINSFAKGHAELIKYRLSEDSPLCGRAIFKMQDVLDGVLICAVERDGALTIPNGGFVLSGGDVVSFIATARNTQKFFKRVGVETRAVKDTLIVGGGKITYYLAKLLHDAGIDVTVIEENPARCRELAEALDGVNVIEGDGTNERLLAESGLNSVGSFIPLTGIDEENILLTLYAKKETNAKVITRIDRMNFHEVITGLDMDSVIYPRFITAESIIAYARARQNSLGSNVETLYKLFDDRAEAIEFRVGKWSGSGKPIMELSLKKNLLIACINRGGKILIPTGHDSITEGDTVIVVTKQSGFHDIEDILI